MDRYYRPLLILAALAAWRWWKDGGGVLGGRTVEALNEFKSKIEPIAKKVEAETGISARLGLLQTALESNNGQSDLSRESARLSILSKNFTGPVVGPARNLFGFKATQAVINAGGAYVMMPTWDYYAKGQQMPNGEVATKDGQALKWPAPFKAYNSWEESYRDWARLLQTKVYAEDGTLAAVRSDDLEAFGRALGVHYAPNQDYVTRLTGRARDYGVVV